MTEVVPEDFYTPVKICTIELRGIALAVAPHPFYLPCIQFLYRLGSVRACKTDFLKVKFQDYSGVKRFRYMNNFIFIDLCYSEL